MADTAQWEYRVETLGSGLRGIKDADFTALLNEWGDQGWEVISVAFSPSASNRRRPTAVAKRLLTASTRRQRTMPESY